MWTCPNCGRIFEKEKQPHSCKKIPIETHFKDKEQAKELFDTLVEQINTKVDHCQIISIPCCVHLFGKYDFLAALPKKDKLEIRFAYHQQIDHPRVTHCVPMSAKVFKICLDVADTEEIDGELMGWLDESYHLKEK